jgi:hypothetical protein
LILLIVLGWLGGTYLTKRYRRVRVSIWRDPKTVFRWSSVDPVLALRGLEGNNPQVVFRAALERGEVETAYATLAYAVDLDSEARSSLLLLLAQDKASDTQQAIRHSCYKMAASVATVASDMSDLTRATRLLAAGRGLKGLGDSADALFYLDQVYAVIRYSERMTQAHRQALLDELDPLYRELGRRPETWQSVVDQVLTPALPTVEAAPAVPRLERPGFLYHSDTVMQATASRQRMVQEVLQATAPGKDSLSKYQLDDLASVLQHEEQVRQQSYTENAEPGQRLGVARDRVAWMVLKYRIAQKGFGVSIVPEWEKQVDKIEAELSAAQKMLYAQYRSNGGSGIEQAVLLLQLEHGMLGFYPDWPQVDWAMQLERLQPRQKLRVGAEIQNQNVHFFLMGEPDT